jgi:hypothetical protein
MTAPGLLWLNLALTSREQILESGGTCLLSRTALVTFMNRVPMVSANMHETIEDGVIANGNVEGVSLFLVGYNSPVLRRGL